tara:strand:- start:1909 stop:2469 length:561 start_codon:yes stop_codon:yes gene_type:complete
MNNQNLLVINFQELFNILNELDEFLNFKVINVKKKELSDLNLNDFENYLVLSKDNLNISNQLIINDFPIKILKLLEKINIEFLKKKFNEQSNFKVGNYTVDVNSRQIILKDNKLKLTEKEVNTILYLSRNIKPTSINELQEKVWGYQSDLETHTVETHIHRLRKKIKEKFKDDELILSDKNGYKII